MDKILRNAVIGLLVVIGVSVIYYFFLLLPQKETQIEKQNLVSNQIKCREAGQKYEEKINAVASQMAITNAPEYVYSHELNTCLYRNEISFYLGDGTLSSQDYSIIDLYSGKEIDTWLRHYNLAGKQNSESGDGEKYKADVEKYFGETNVQ